MANLTDTPTSGVMDAVAGNGQVATGDVPAAADPRLTQPMGLTNGAVQVLQMQSGKVGAICPYDADFVAWAKDHGGAFSAIKIGEEESKAWIFGGEEEIGLREILSELYGTDGEEVPGMNILVDVSALGAIGDELSIGGRPVAYRASRDVAVQLGLGVTVIEGGFAPKGGSSKHPDLAAEPGTVIEVQDLPAPVLDRVAGQLGDALLSFAVSDGEEGAAEPPDDAFPAEEGEEEAEAAAQPVTQACGWCGGKGCAKCAAAPAPAPPPPTAGDGAAPADGGTVVLGDSAATAPGTVNVDAVSDAVLVAALESRGYKVKATPASRRRQKDADKAAAKAAKESERAARRGNRPARAPRAAADGAARPARAPRAATTPVAGAMPRLAAEAGGFAWEQVSSVRWRSQIGADLYEIVRNAAEKTFAVKVNGTVVSTHKDRKSALAAVAAQAPAAQAPLAAPPEVLAAAEVVTP